MGSEGFCRNTRKWGVNKPSYLLFIYKLDDMREVTPS